MSQYSTDHKEQVKEGGEKIFGTMPWCLSLVLTASVKLFDMILQDHYGFDNLNTIVLA